MSKTCVVVIYNHQFTDNIEKIEKIFKDRFAKIYHIMPFYTGNRENVIPVYENSYQFEGYVAQVADEIYNEEYDYYAFVGDDCVLDPKLNDTNIEEILKIDENTGFTARNIFVTNETYITNKIWLYPSIQNFMQAYNKEDVEKILPTPAEMEEKFKTFGMAYNSPLMSENQIKFFQDFTPMHRTNSFFYKYTLNKKEEFDFLKLLKSYKPEEGEAIKTMFPFAGGFSDFFVIPGRFLRKFAYISGVFASMRIFAEVAVPTALCIVLDNLSYPKKAGLTAMNYSASDEKRATFPDEYNRSIKTLFEKWVDKRILIHPVKYSGWELDID